MGDDQELKNEARREPEEREPTERTDETPREERRPRGEKREHRLRDMARRILTDRDRPDRDRPDRDRPDRDRGDRERPEEGGRDLQDTARDAVVALLETGDRAKTEFMRLAAREVRAYLTELKVGDGIQHMLTNYSLELHASVSLKPLVEGEELEPTKVKIKPLAKEEEDV